MIFPRNCTVISSSHFQEKLHVITLVSNCVNLNVQNQSLVSVLRKELLLKILRKTPILESLFDKVHWKVDCGTGDSLWLLRSFKNTFFTEDPRGDSSDTNCTSFCERSLFKFCLINIHVRKYLLNWGTIWEIWICHWTFPASSNYYFKSISETYLNCSIFNNNCCGLHM